MREWSWDWVKGLFWGVIALSVVFVLFYWWTPIRMTVWPFKYDCRYTYDHRYEIYTDTWRTIPLGVGPDGKEGIWLSHGQAVTPEQFGDMNAEKVKLKYFKKVRDGNYVVIFRHDDRQTISVWTPELLDEWRRKRPDHFRRIKYDSDNGCPFYWPEE